MLTSTFPNGQSLTSSALTPDDVHKIFQPLVARILGLDPDADPNGAYSAVRVGWQQEGQPGWTVDEDICAITASLDTDDEYGAVRDEIRLQDGYGDPMSRRMGYTQVWRLGLSFYGPNCAARARLVLSAMVLDWVADAISANRLHVVPEWRQPVYAPEPFQGRWWKRCDLDLRFNEQVTETTAADTAAGLDITILTDTGLSTEVHIEPPQEGA